jgi:DNA-binding transcriptional regulator YiaG
MCANGDGKSPLSLTFRSFSSAWHIVSMREPRTEPQTETELIAEMEVCSIVHDLYKPLLKVGAFWFSDRWFDSACKMYESSAEPPQAALLRMRREHNLSRRQLAAMLGVTKHSLRSWEEGKRQPSDCARKFIWLLSAVVAGKPPPNLWALATWVDGDGGQTGDTAKNGKQPDPDRTAHEIEASLRAEFRPREGELE